MPPPSLTMAFAMATCRSSCLMCAYSLSSSASTLRFFRGCPACAGPRGCSPAHPVPTPVASNAAGASSRNSRLADAMLRSRFAFERLTRAYCVQLFVCYLCLAQIGSLEDCQGEPRPAEVSLAQVRANEGRLAKICLCQVGSLYIRLRESRLREGRASEVGSLQIRFIEIRLREVRAAQICLAEVNAAEIGSSHLCASELRM